MQRAVLFDMDGLIIDSEPLWRRAQIACFQDLGVTLTEDDCRQTMGCRIDTVIDHWFQRRPWKDVSRAELQAQIIDTMIAFTHSEGRPLPGVLEALELFKSLEFRIGLASSSPLNLIEAVLDALDLRPHFEVVHSAEFEERGKPHPQVFLTAADRLNTAPENCLVLEDSFPGVIAAKAASMQVIAVPDTSAPLHRGMHAADLILTSLDELRAEKVLELLPTTR